jgi:hypothetical protein
MLERFHYWFGHCDVLVPVLCYLYVDPGNHGVLVFLSSIASSCPVLPVPALYYQFLSCITSSCPVSPVPVLYYQFLSCIDLYVDPVDVDVLVPVYPLMVVQET